MPRSGGVLRPPCPSGSYRAGVVVLGVLGVAMCIVGSSVTKETFGGPFVALARRWAGSFVLLVVGLITGTRTPFVALALVIEVLWVAATIRHAVGAAGRPRPEHRAAAPA